MYTVLLKHPTRKVNTEGTAIASRALPAGIEARAAAVAT